MENPILFWHLPKNIAFLENKLRKQNKGKEEVFYKKKFVLPNNQEFFCKPRGFLYHDSMEFNSIRMELAKNHQFPLAVTRLYTGDVSFVFRFKINSLANIEALFHMYENQCYYHGSTIPSYVTHFPNKKVENTSQTRIIQHLMPMAKFGEGGRFSKSLEVNTPSDFMNLDGLEYTPKQSGQLDDLKKYFRLPFKPYLIKIDAYLFAGNRLLSKNHETPPVPFSNFPSFLFSIRYPKLKVSSLPLESRLSFNIKIVSNEGQELIIGSASVHLFDTQGKLINGNQQTGVWPFVGLDEYMNGVDPFLGSSDYLKAHDVSPCYINLLFDSYATDVYYTIRDRSITSELYHLNNNNASLNVNNEDADKIPTTHELVQVNTLLDKDPLHSEVSDQEKDIMMRAREYLSEIPNTLTYFLTSVQWSCPENIYNVVQSLEGWLPISGYTQYVLLLGPRFHTEAVRTFAVKQLEKMSDADFNLHLIFLLLGLCFESDIYSPLTEFIIERSLKNMPFIGVPVYWILRSWMSWRLYKVRFTVIVEQILQLAGNSRSVLFSMNRVSEYFKSTVKQMIRARPKKNTEFLKDHLNPKKRPGELPETIIFPHDYAQPSTTISYQNSKAINKKKTSVLVQCPNLKRNLANFQLTFKYQEHIFQDLVCFKLIELFDHWWMEKGLDLKITTIKLTPVDDMIGFGQVIEGAENLKIIVDKFGTGVKDLELSALLKFIEMNNKGPAKDTALEMFRRSLAGYCVATYVLGIAEKDDTFIMIHESGRLFHRTFGEKILGRTPSPLIAFSPQMRLVIGKENEDYFYNLCNTALIILRKQSYQLINLLDMLIPANLPGFEIENCLKHVRATLNLSGSDADACQNFKLVMESSVNSTLFKRDMIGEGDFDDAY